MVESTLRMTAFVYQQMVSRLRQSSGVKKANRSLLKTVPTAYGELFVRFRTKEHRVELNSQEIELNSQGIEDRH